MEVRLEMRLSPAERTSGCVCVWTIVCNPPMAWPRTAAAASHSLLTPWPPHDQPDRDGDEEVPPRVGIAKAETHYAASTRWEGECACAARPWRDSGHQMWQPHWPARRRSGALTRRRSVGHATSGS